MSSDQEKGTEEIGNVSTCKASPVSEPTPLDFPAFEYELEENVQDISTIESVNSMPNFEVTRHPHAKLFVIILAILSNILIIYQSARTLPLQYRSIFCSLFNFNDCLEDSDSDPEFIKYFEFYIRVCMEIMVPISVVSAFLATHLANSAIPAMAIRLRNPIPSLAPLIYTTFFFHSLSNIFTSASMLPFLGSTVRKSFWTEYLIVSGLGIFWMYAFLNMATFNRLSVFNFIRARENYQIRLNGENGANF